MKKLLAIASICAMNSAFADYSCTTKENINFYIDEYQQTITAINHTENYELIPLKTAEDRKTKLGLASDAFVNDRGIYVRFIVGLVKPSNYTFLSIYNNATGKEVVTYYGKCEYSRGRQS